MLSSTIGSSSTIWPWWVRLSHWLVAMGVFLLWILTYVYHETGKAHRWIGYTLISIICMRVLAGCFTQSRTARFLIPSKQQLQAHIAHLRQLQLPAQHGHNPLGQLAVYWIWTCIAILALTGWLSRTDWFWGEDWPVIIHAWFSYILIVTVALHVLAVYVVSRLSHQHLISQMIDGKLRLFRPNHTLDSED